jgi:glucose 1-dehydrogenase/3-oxoacyl-[acyl-carrier protein] reductase
MSFDHSGRAAIVTGAGSGIGRATARRLAKDGASVAVWDINGEAALETTTMIEEAGGHAVAITADVRDRGSVQAGRQDTVAAFTDPLRYLVNNAGLVRMSSLEELTDEEWDLVLDTNLKGMFVVTQELFREIAANGGGAIVNLSTIEAEVVVASRGFPQPHYNASKGGVKMLTKAMAVELAKFQIRVNAVAPGAIATGFVPGADWSSPEAWDSIKDRVLVPRAGEPEDVAAGISFLLSDDASYVTGAQLPIDGGWLAR